MQRFEYTITDSVGIHARPASELVKTVKKFQSRIQILAGGKQADASRLMSVMALGIKKGTEISVVIEGPDEEMALSELSEFFRTNL